MTNSISLTVPLNDYNALTRMSDMLHGLAVDLEKCGGPINKEPERNEQMVAYAAGVAESYPEAREQNNEGDTIGGDCAQSLNHPTVGAAIPALETIDLEPLRQETTAVEAFPNVDPSTIVTVTPTVATVSPTLASAAVELAKDSTGAMIPWDERIHGNGVNKTKADGSWKYKRNIDKATIPAIEAELRAAMAVPTPNAQPAAVVVSPTVTPAIVPTVDAVPNVAPVVEQATTAPTVATTAEPTPTVQPAVVATATPGNAITTLGALMGAATAAGKTPADMQAAVVAAGLTSPALLGARPDLIPTVAASLGLGG